MEQFLKAVKEQVNIFKSFIGKSVKLVSHLDSDGLSSSAIMIRALFREGISFSLSTVKQLDDQVLEELQREQYPLVFFLDLGSGSLSKIEKSLRGKEIFVLDHHAPEAYSPKKLHFLNPHLYSVDGNKDISGAGVCYLFAKALNPDNMEMAHIALLGAIGDMQESSGFSELNTFILEDALAMEKIEIRESLRMFGMQTRPINKMLEYTTDPYIPGVTGSEEGAKRFIDSLNIDAKIDGKYKKLFQLKLEDLKKLVTGIILQRIGSEDKPDDVLGKIYLLKEEEDESPMKDAKEFSTLLNACGRMDRAVLGIGCCLNDSHPKREAISLLSTYKREIIQGLNWFHKNRDQFIHGEGYVIINAGIQVRDTMIGTIASIISKNAIYENGTIIMSMAYTLDGHIKVSIRSVNNKEVDLKEKISAIIDKVGGISGGHKFAAGALISQDKEEEFIKEACAALNSQ